MTRDEDAIIEAKKYYRNDIKCYDAFLHGVEWAEEQIANVWHDANEEPICGKRLLLLHTNSVVSIFNYTGKNDWSMLASCGIYQYAYISDLLPKGGEK